MKRRAILVNGVPASGKSSVARAISRHFDWPLLSLDEIKEPFFEHFGVGDRDCNRKLGRASYAAIFNLIAQFPDRSTTVVDAWFGFQSLEILKANLARAGIAHAIEIWCHADPQHGQTFEQAAAARQAAGGNHNSRETPHFAESIARRGLAKAAGK